MDPFSLTGGIPSSINKGFHSMCCPIESVGASTPTLSDISSCWERGRGRDRNLGTMDLNVTTMDQNLGTMDWNVTTMDQNLRTMDWNVTTIDRGLYFWLFLFNNAEGWWVLWIEYLLKTMQCFYYPLLATVGVPGKSLAGT